MYFWFTASPSLNTGLSNLWPMGHIWPMEPFDLACKCGASAARLTQFGSDAGGQVQGFTLCHTVGQDPGKKYIFFTFYLPKKKSACFIWRHVVCEKIWHFLIFVQLYATKMTVALGWQFPCFLDLDLIKLFMQEVNKLWCSAINMVYYLKMGLQYRL